MCEGRVGSQPVEHAVSTCFRIVSHGISRTLKTGGMGATSMSISSTSYSLFFSEVLPPFLSFPFSLSLSFTKIRHDTSRYSPDSKTIQVARIYRCSCNFFSWRLLARYVGTRFAPIKLYGEFFAFFSFFLFSKIIDAVVSIVRGSNLCMKDRENDRIHGNPITFFTQTTKQSFQQLFMLCSCGIYKGERERERERKRLSEFVS